MTEKREDHNGLQCLTNIEDQSSYHNIPGECINELNIMADSCKTFQPEKLKTFLINSVLPLMTNNSEPSETRVLNLIISYIKSAIPKTVRVPDATDLTCYRHGFEGMFRADSSSKGLDDMVNAIHDLLSDVLTKAQQMQSAAMTHSAPESSHAKEISHPTVTSPQTHQHNLWRV